MHSPSVTSAHSSKLMGRKLLTMQQTDDIGFVADEGDYNVVSELLSCNGFSDDEIKICTRELVKYDEEGRVYEFQNLYLLRCQSRFSELARSMGLLDNLQGLYLPGSKIAILPPSVKELKNLKTLDLTGAWKLQSLPEEIGDIINLTTLYLCCSGISSLPSSIGRLRNLKSLYLGSIDKLESLPKEIGDLLSLKSLHLSYSGITSLPSSIGRLKNLEHLDLFYTPLAFRLYSHATDYRSPRSCPTNPPLPNEIVELTSLEIFNVKPLISLPRYLWEHFGYTKACDRAMKRLGFGSTTDDNPELSSIPSSLWPHLLGNIERAFLPPSSMKGPGHSVSFLCRDYRITKQDAIYKLIKDNGREAFIQLLLHRDTLKDIRVVD